MIAVLFLLSLAAPSPCPDPALERLEARFAAEPPIDVVHGWVVSAAQLQPGRADQLVRDARARGALPLLRLRGRYDDRSNRKWDEVERPRSRDHDADFQVDLWLEWDLAELAMGPDQLRAVREGRALGELRQALLAEATLVFFDRQRVLTEAALDPQATPAARAERRLRASELDATLDALTAGQWSESRSSLPEVPPAEDACHERVDRPGEDPDPGLRVPVHPADRPADP